MPTIYRSKLDTWLLIILIGAIGVGAAACVAALAAGGAKLFTVVIPTAAFAIGLPIWVLLSTRYTLDEETLTARSGPFRWRVPIAQITAVTPTHDPRSSPALSLDRLQISYGSGKTLMISPADKEIFLADLERLMRKPARLLVRDRYPALHAFANARASCRSHSRATSANAPARTLWSNRTDSQCCSFC